MASFAIMAVLVVPAVTLAQPLEKNERVQKQQEKQEEKRAEIQARKEERVQAIQERRQEAFCSRFSKEAERLAKNLAERRSKFDERKEDRIVKTENKAAERDMKLEEKRSGADERRSAMYDKLLARATTEEQKQAVADFQKTVEAAVDTRRDTVNAAIEAFRSGVKNAVAGRKGDMDSAASKFQSAVEAALAKAKADCANITDQEAVRTTFKESLKAAREALVTDRKDADKVGEQVKKLAEARRVAVKKAMEDFKKTLSDARASLKLAFGETDDADDTKTESTEENN